MKKIILSSLISILSLVVLSCIFALSLSLLHFHKGVKLNYYVIETISIILFLFAGMIFGLINKKQGLIGSIIFVLVYFIFTLIFDVFMKNHHVDSFYFLFIIGKCLAYIFGSILSVNIVKR